MAEAQPVVTQLPLAALSEVHEIQDEAGDTPWGEPALRATLSSPNCFVLGARRGGALVGYICVQRAADEAHVLNVVVRHASQRSGVGEALVHHAIARLFQEGITSVFLEVRRSNIAAQRLYSKLGFYEVGVRSRYYRDTGEDALVLRCNIRAALCTMP